MSGTEAVDLGPGDLAFVPVEHGDWVNASSDSGSSSLQLGFADGEFDVPDTVTWQPMGASQLHVPAWNTAPYVAVRAGSRVRLNVLVSSPEVNPVDWYFWDDKVAEWARHGAALPTPNRRDIHRILTAIEDLRGGIPDGERANAGALLVGLWLEESSRIRPLSRPFFLRLPETPETAPRLLVGPTRIKFPKSAADLHRWQLRAKGPTRVILREGGAIARVVDWQPTADRSNEWTRTQNVRTVPLDAAALPEIEVVTGIVSASVCGFDFQPEFRELVGLARRLRTRLWSESAVTRKSWLRHSGSQGATAPEGRSAASRHSATSALNAYLLRLESQSTELFEPAVLAMSRAMQSGAGSAWLELVDQRLLDLGVLDAPYRQRQLEAQKAFGLNRSQFETDPKNPMSPSDATLPERGSQSQDFNRTLLDALLPSRLGRRPTWGESIESRFRAHPDDALVGRLAHKYWNAFPFRNVAASPGTATTARLIALGGSGLCNPARDNIEAWFVPSRDSTEFSIDVENDIYAIATLRPTSATPTTEGELSIDGIPITLHSGAGVSSRVALSAGRHTVTKIATTPAFAIEATQGMLLPCQDLFRWQRWARLQPGSATTFPLPSPGASSAARVRFDSVDGPTRLTVNVGSRQFDVSARPPGHGTAEIPIGASDDTLSIRTDRTVSVSVALRREFDPVIPPQSLPPLSNSTPPVADQLGQQRPLSAELLTELLDVGRRLRSSAGAAEAPELRRRRAKLLVRLGFASLAARDSESLPVVEPRADLVRIDNATSRVIPIGILPGIAPLALPMNQESLVTRFEARRDSRDADCAMPLNEQATTSPNAETLLGAVCAERLGLFASAAHLYSSIAHSNKHAPTLLHAATLLVDAAATSQDRKLVITAAIWAAHAMEWGSDASSLRARLSKAIRWISPNVLTGAAGVSAIAHGLGDIPTNRQRVLETLVSAPKDALLVEAGQAAELLTNARQVETVSINFGCDSPSDATPCTLYAFVDSNPTSCETDGSLPRCRLVLPPGKHRIRLAFTGDESIGWLTGSLGNSRFLPSIATDWSVLDGGTEATVVVRGPTVLQLRARGSGSEGETISVRGCDIENVHTSLQLPVGRDAQARPWPSEVSNIPLGLALERWIPIESESQCELRIGAQQSNTRIRIAFARADTLPAARLVDTMQQTPANNEPIASAMGRVRDLGVATPRHVPELLPLLVGARTRFVSESLAVALEQDSSSSESAFQDVYGETSAFVARELLASRWWGTLQAGARFRSGPTTEFGKLSLDMPPLGNLVGVDLTSSIYSQSFGQTRSTTLSSTGRLSRRFAISQKAAVIPQFSFTTMRVGAEPSNPFGVDGDVFSNFYQTHPRYASLAATVAARPSVDALINLSLSSRSLPQLNGVDRFSATAELIFLPVPNWPVLGGLDWMSSYRPESSLRKQTFVRHNFGIAWGLWHWITAGERARWFGRVDFFLDAPAASLGGIIVAPTVGLEIVSTGARGLRDLSPQQVPMREFQEHGSARIRSSRVGALDDSLTSGVAP